MIIRNPLNEHQVEMFQNSNKEWEWHIICKSENIVLKCCQSYKNYDDCASILNMIFCKNKPYQVLTEVSNEQWTSKIQFNGELVAISKEYPNKNECETSLNNLLSEDYRKM